MAKGYSYIISVKDIASSRLSKIAQTAGAAYNKIGKYQTRQNKKVFKGAKNLDKLRNKYDNLGKQQGTAKTIKEFAKINKELRTTARQSKKLENLPPQGFITRLFKSKNAVKDLRKSAVKLLGTIGLFAAVKGVSKLGLDLEQTRVKFETLLGGRAKANKLINDLDKFANKTPFENADLQRNAELLLNFGTANKKILPTLKMLGDVSGGNKDKLNSLTLAYAQIQSTGKLMGQDLNQMINAGFNPLQVISEKTGVSMGKLKDYMSKGSISAKMVEDAFVSATSKGGRFFGMMEKSSTTGSGLISTLLGKVNTKLAQFSEQYVVPTIKKLVTFAIKLVDGFDTIKNSVLRLVMTFKPLWNAVSVFVSGLLGVSQSGDKATSTIALLSGIIDSLAIGVEIVSNGIITLLEWLEPLTPLIKKLVFAYGLWKVAQWAINIAMAANPVGLVITGIVALVGVITYAYQKVGWFRGGILAIWETIKGFASLIKNAVVNRIKEFITGIVGLGKTLLLFFQGKWKKAWETGKQATKDLIGVGTVKKTISDAKKIGERAGKAYQKGVLQASKTKNFNPVKSLINKSALAAGVSKASAKGLNLSESDAFKDGISGITGGGSKQTNINVQFGKLIESLVINSETLDEGVDQMEDKIIEVMLRVLNSANHLQTS